MAEKASYLKPGNNLGRGKLHNSLSIQLNGTEHFLQRQWGPKSLDWNPRINLAETTCTTSNPETVWAQIPQSHVHPTCSN